MSDFRLVLSGKKQGQNWYSVYLNSQRYAQLEFNEERCEYYALFTQYASNSFSAGFLGAVAAYLKELNAKVGVSSIVDDDAITAEVADKILKPRTGRLITGSRIQWVVDRLATAEGFREEYDSLVAAVRETCDSKPRAAVTLSEMAKKGLIQKQFALTNTGLLRSKVSRSSGT